MTDAAEPDAPQAGRALDAHESGSDWPRSGGELGALIRGFDWSRTSLGRVATWPQSLRTATEMVLHSPIPIVMLWGEDGVMLYNDAYSGFAGGRHPLLLGSKVREGWPEVADFNDNVMRVCLAGGTLAYHDQELTLHRSGTPEQVWMNLDYSPVIGESGEPAGVLAIVVETTDRIRAERALRAERDRSQGILDTMAEGFILLDGDFRILRINAEALRIEGRAEAELVGRTHWEAWPDTEHSEIGQLYRRAMRDRVPVSLEHQFVWAGGRSAWLELRAYPSDGGLALFYRDVTERKRTEEALAASEARLRSITDFIDQMIWSTQPDGYHDYFNARWYEYTGVPAGSTDGEGWNGIFHPDDQDRAWTRWRHSLATGEPYEIEYRLRHHSGAYRWVLGRAQPVRDATGRITRWFGTCTDVHDQKLAEDDLRRSRDQLASESHALEVLNRTGIQVAAELGVDTLVQRVVDAGVELTGAAHGAFFYNVQHGDERSMLYALSGEQGSAFAGLGMPGPTALFTPTFTGEAIIRSGDILQDARYGKTSEHGGVPPGHAPVLSYLAVPVVSRTSEVIGGLLFGHPAPDMFTERSERLVTGLAAQAAIGIDNARLFEAVQRANAELEERVLARTAELESAHEALRQAQKMEAVGQLTGGIAHDFNNMLAVVIGSLDLLRRRIDQTDARKRRYLDAAAEGAKRAALLTQRLLAFSRQQPLRPEPIDVNSLVAGMSDLLRHSIGGHVRLETVLAGGLWRSHADPNQLENVILNLAVNGRDAMPDGGRLTIETQNTHLDTHYAAAHPGVAAGQYVMVAVTDTGSGMPAEIVARAFDPFFTTKEVGKGTGLGLSQAYGFVKQSGGHVKIYSEPGQGTSVKIYLPRLIGKDVAAAADTTTEDVPFGDQQECVLVVEDEPAVRQFSLEALRELGYRVLEAEGAATALQLLDAHPDIALLFTDVVMPDVNGRKLAEAARQRRPDLKVLFTTGYSRNAVIHNGVLDPGVQLIGKPFTLEELAAKVREVLDAPPSIFET